MKLSIYTVACIMLVASGDDALTCLEKFRDCKKKCKVENRECIASGVDDADTCGDKLKACKRPCRKSKKKCKD